MKVIDLTLTVRDHWRWPVGLETTQTYEDNFFLQQLIHFNPHSFTHVDAPLHFLPDGCSIEEVPLEKFCGEAAVVDLSHLGENDGVTAAELDKHGQHIRASDIVLLRTDWPLKCDYMTKDFWTKAPYTARDACEWLVERNVKTVGYDYPCDYLLRYEVLNPNHKSKREDNTTHDVFFKHGIMVIEYVVNQHLLKKTRVQFMALPIPFEGAGGSPVRAIAIEE